MRDIVVTPKDGVAWVTGASSGIGEAVAIALAREGFTVAITARRRSELEAVAARAAADKKAKGRLVPFEGDITDAVRMTEIVAEIERGLGPLALAILNAGIYLRLDAPTFEAATMAKACTVNLIGTGNCLEPVIAAMVRRERGHIALVSSVTGYGGLPMCGAYGATKAGLINLAQCLKLELQPWNVRVTIVNPGFVDTPAQDDLNFPKPAIVSAETAAREIVRGLERQGFEISFPKRFTWTLKALNMLPRGAYLALVRRATGWHVRKPLQR